MAKKKKKYFGHYPPVFKVVVFRLQLSLSATPFPTNSTGCVKQISLFKEPFVMAEPLSRNLKGNVPMH